MVHTIYGAQNQLQIIIIRRQQMNRNENKPFSQCLSLSNIRKQPPIENVQKFCVVYSECIADQSSFQQSESWNVGFCLLCKTLQEIEIDSTSTAYDQNNGKSPSQLNLPVFQSVPLIQSAFRSQSSAVTKQIANTLTMLNFTSFIITREVSPTGPPPLTPAPQV